MESQNIESEAAEQMETFCRYFEKSQRALAAFVAACNKGPQEFREKQKLALKKNFDDLQSKLNCSSGDVIVTTDAEDDVASCPSQDSLSSVIGPDDMIEVFSDLNRDGIGIAGSDDTQTDQDGMNIIQRQSVQGSKNLYGIDEDKDESCATKGAVELVDQNSSEESHGSEDIMDTAKLGDEEITDVSPPQGLTCSKEDEELDNMILKKKESSMKVGSRRFNPWKPNKNIIVITEEDRIKYQCRICKNKTPFTTKCHTYYHEHCHKSPKDWPFQCGKCQQRFKAKQLLKKHEKSGKCCHFE